MPRELISRRTRRELRELLVFDWKLSTISELFDNHDVKFIPLPEDRLPIGERRSLVECYYADPSLAIGSTKELIEATLKTILNGCKVEYNDKKDDITRLLKQVQMSREIILDLKKEVALG